MPLGMYIGRRLLFGVPQIVGIVIVTFLLVRLLPGNPAFQLAGPYGSPQAIAAIKRDLGLDKPLLEQFLIYVGDLAGGNLGISWFSTEPVGTEIANRLPATLELITIASLFIVVGGIAGGVYVAVRQGGVVDRVVGWYGSLAGAFPDFWLGLVLAFVFYFTLRLAPAPLGQLDADVPPPSSVTGMYVVDALLTGNWTALRSAITHLILPVATLVIVFTAPVLKMTRSTMEAALRSEMCTFARACGLSERMVIRYALRNSLGPILTLVGLTYAYLLGGVVLIEKVFSWGGLGSYVVDSVVRSDYYPVQAFVLIAAVFNFVVYLVVDLVHRVVDPRVGE